MNKLYISCLALFLFASCSVTEEATRSTFISPSPISEIQERLYLSPEDSVVKVTTVLERHQFLIPDGFTPSYRFSTNAVKIRDKMCEGQYFKNAPLTCEVRMHGALVPKGENETVVRMIYQETCAGQTHIPSRCKNSNAEKLLFSILQELKE